MYLVPEILIINTFFSHIVEYWYNFTMDSLLFFEENIELDSVYWRSQNIKEMSRKWVVMQRVEANETRRKGWGFGRKLPAPWDRKNSVREKIHKKCVKLWENVLPQTTIPLNMIFLYFLHHQLFYKLLIE